MIRTLKASRRAGLRADAVRLGAEVAHADQDPILSAAVTLAEGGNAMATLARLSKTHPEVTRAVRTTFDLTEPNPAAIARYLLGVSVGITAAAA